MAFLNSYPFRYAVVENLRNFLSQFNTSDPIWFGYNRTRFAEAKDAIGFHEGAGMNQVFRDIIHFAKQSSFKNLGYVLSREATRRFAEIG